MNSLGVPAACPGVQGSLGLCRDWVPLLGAQVYHPGVLTCTVLIPQLEAGQHPSEHTRGAAAAAEA